MQNNRWKKVAEQHPIWIIAIVVAGSVLFTLTVVSHQHDLVIAQKDATIENLSARIEDLEQEAAQNKQIEVPGVETSATENRFSILTNEQLKLKALEIVVELRRISKVWESKVEPMRLKSIRYTRDPEQKLDDYRQTKEKLWKAYGEERDKLRTVYETKYKIDCAVLRDELEKRLPQGLRKKTAEATYRTPYLYEDLQKIVWDLELAAKNLPL